MDFANILCNKASGVLKISDSKIDWTPQQQGETSSVSITQDQISNAEFFISIRGYELRIWLKKNTASFDGFKRGDFEKLKDAFSRLGKEIQNVPIDSLGGNWGKLAMHSAGGFLVFETEDGRKFDIPVNSIKNCSKTPKASELIIELMEDEKHSKQDDVLMEMRFQFPKGKDANDIEDDEDGEESKTSSSTKDGSTSAMDLIHQALVNRGNLSTVGDAIIAFEQLNFVTPRGKYDVEIFDSFLRLHGKTHDFRINYQSISTTFLLQKPASSQYFFVLSLDEPLRTGKTPHYHLVIVFDAGAKVEASNAYKLNLPDAEIEKEYKSKGLSKEMSGAIYEIVAKVIRAFTGKKLIGAGKFQSSMGDKAIKCSLKANEGSLYFLEKSIFFLYKPCLYIRHEEIKTIKFQRAEGSGSKTFDVEIKLKSSKSFTFSNIQKQEYDVLTSFLDGKGLNIENTIQQQQEQVANAYAALGQEDESEDEDFVGDEDDEDADDKEFDDIVAKDVDEVSDGDDMQDEGEAKPKKKKSSNDSDKPKESKKRKRDEKK